VRSIKDKDGWFATGDVGAWDEATGGLKIVDRIKNIFKLQQGEFVSVEKIEGVVNSGVTYVEQCWAYGDPTRRFIVGVVVVDEKWRQDMEAELLEGESLEVRIVRAARDRLVKLTSTFL
jgi:long-subunit acyl-CoA synthetase (AMP-forming)